MKITEDISIGLRAGILQMSLSIEDSTNKLLLIILQVGKECEKRKALGNKSSSISLNSKASLLFDLDILTANEYKKINFFSQFRNQFIHNMNCTSFVQAIELLGADRGRDLLKYATLTDNNEEEKYRDSYKALYNEIINIINVKIESYKSEQMRNGKTIYTFITHVNFIKKREIELLQRIENICEEHKKMNGEELLALIKNEITNELHSDSRKEKSKEFREAIDNSKYFIPKIPPEMRKDVKPTVNNP